MGDKGPKKGAPSGGILVKGPTSSKRAENVSNNGGFSNPYAQQLAQSTKNFMMMPGGIIVKDE